MKEGLSTEKLDLLKKMLKAKGVATLPDADGPRPRAGADAPRLSYSQQRLWFLDKFDPENKAFNIPAMLRLRGNLDAARLREAIGEVVRRHEILRTGFVLTGDEALQTVRENVAIALPVKDLSRLGENERNALVEQAASAAARAEFSLENPPLIEFELLKTAPDEHILVLAMHHIISDGWSVGVLIKEISEIYSAFEENRAPELPVLPVQYADYAVWQRRRIEAGKLEKQLLYWTEKLAGDLPVLDLPVDRPRSQSRTREGASLRVEFDAPLTAGINELARKNGTTLFVALLAGYKILLHRYARQHEIVVGTSVAGRNHTEIEPLIGFFLNTLVLRSTISGAESFADFLRRTARLALEAFENQDVPVELLIERLKPERRPGVSPLFQTLFVLQNNPSPEMRIGSLAAEIIEIETRSAKFDLSVSAAEKDGRLALAFEYDTNLFERETIERMAAHYRHLMRRAAADGTVAVGALDLLDEPEKRRLFELAQGRIRTEDFAPVNRLIADQARRTPAAPALRDEEKSLTYGELEASANRLARLLMENGVRVEDRIGLYFDRSPEMIVALLAVLKAGAVYVPIDPLYPRERISFIARDAALSLVLTHRRVDAGAGFDCPLLVWEDWQEKLAEISDAEVNVRIGAENPAYVIYTSGSTGQPKGVVTRHGGLSNYARHARSEFRLTAADKVLQFASASFDASAEEIFPCLMAGGTLVLRTDAMVATMDEFVRSCRERKITVLDLPTAFWHLLVEAMENENLRLPESLRLMIIGGERANPAAVAKWARMVRAKVELRNTYGPTEATIVATAEVFSETGNESESGLGIGSPIANTRVYVADERLEIVPAGVAGELLIGGAGLARGYLNRPALTAEKFIPDPFAAEPGARVYRTGDLARWNRAGKLEFMGRADRQVKVRGYRVELGEIETALAQSKQIKRAAVLAAGERLTAYLVKAEPAERLDGEALRGEIEARLPAYLRPQLYVEVEEIPLTPHGKIDEKALKRMDSVELRAASPEARAMPAGETETEIARIWTELLGVSEIGRAENFFELGGHSLLVTKFLARLRNRFGAQLPLRDFFENPTIEAAAKAVASPRAETALAAVPKIEKAPPEALIPLSFPQERVWFLCQLDPTNVAYNVTRAARVRGRLDREMVERAFTEIFRRHEILRTTFHAVDGRIAQRVHEPQPVKIRLVDLRRLPAEQRERETKEFIEREGNHVFNLAELPLLRLNLLRQADDEHVLFMVEHHLLHDGWTQGVLMNEFVRIYEAFAEGRPSPLAPLKIQYGDFAYWQRNYLQGENLERLLAFWRKTLSGAPVLLQLPTTFPRPPVRSSRGGEVIWEIDEALAADLRELSRRNNATLYMTMLAAFKILFYRYSGQRDIVVGAGVANRGVREIEELIGMVVNTIPLRTQVSGEISFTDLLGRMRGAALDAYAHQDVPFEKLVEAINPPRSLAYTPIFQVLISFLNTPMRTMRLAGLEIEAIDGHNKSAKFDLNVIVVSPEDQNRGLQAQAENKRLTVLVEYSADLYDEAGVREMVGHYERLLRSIVAAPHQRLKALDFLAGEEKSRLAALHRGKSEIVPEETHLVRAFEARAAATPDAAALRFGGEVLTYAELNARANRLAHYLSARGARPETRVGISVNRSPRLLVALLAVLKAGASYVPLDPIYPRERVEYALNDAGAEFLITEKSLAADAGAFSGKLILLDEDPGAGFSEANPAVAVSPDNLAYVIYTSGSTGQPKGVAVTRRSLANFLSAMREKPKIHPNDRLLATTTVSFDIAVLELFLPLTVGAEIVLAAPGEAADAERLKALLESSRATVCQATPATWQMLAASGWKEPGLKILCGGEALPAELAAALKRRGGELWNMYGPTETTVWASCEDLTNKDGEITLGAPLLNTRFYVVDENLSPVPAGVAGELLIGGANLARGYLNRPALTAEKFIPDPFAAEPGARVYRTGDLVKMQPGGGILFLGRIDDQVKLRGYRIELGEIEAALSSIAGIEKTVVSVIGSFQEKQLVAYLVTGEMASELTESSLRRALEKRLPFYMIPSLFVFLDAFPLTPNGKIDRRALPVPAEVKRKVENRTAPETATELALAKIWRELLKIGEVYREDDFFAVGGHSLLATRMVSRIGAVCGVSVSLRAIFEKMTLRAIAGEIDRLAEGPKKTATAPRKREFLKHAPLSYAQKRLWFLHRLAPESAVYNIPYAVKLTGKLDVPALAKALREVVGRHEVLRSKFAEIDGAPAQVVGENEFELAIEDFSGDGGFEKALDFARAEADRPFDLEAETAFRASLLKTPDDGAVLLLNIHHIAADGWSIGVLLAEVSALYRDLTGGGTVSLPALALQYADYAAWQAEQLRGESYDRQLAFWREELAGAPTVLNLPTDFPRPAVQSGKGASETFRLDARAVENLKNLSRDGGGTLFMTLLAAVYTLLRRYAGQRDLLIGTPVAGRERAELEPLIGCFINMLVLRVSAGGDSSFRDLLAAVRETALRAFENQDAPFEALIEELRPERSLGRTPLFQVLLAFQNAPESRAALPGVELAVLPLENKNSRGDLHFNFTENDGEIFCLIEYNTDIFAAETIRRMGERLRRLLENVCRDPDRKLDAISLLDADEKERFIDGPNRTAKALSAETIIELVTRRAKASPESPALRFSGGETTYGELETRAEIAARALVRHGVKRGEAVGILADRSAETIVALLAVLKAGGAYLPIDPDFPASRIEFMLADSGARVVLGNAARRRDFAGGGTDFIAFDALFAGADDEHEVVLPPTGADDAAYIVYTSGSTGRPKGVVVAHRSIVRLVEADYLQPVAEDVFLQYAPVSFDASTFEIWTCLAHGARLVVAPPEKLSAAALGKLIADEGITVLWLTSGLFHLMIDEQIGNLGNLRYLVAGGAVLLPEKVRRGVRHLPGCQIINGYGPTETTTFACCHAIENDERENNSVPIGVPITNTRVYVADERLEIVPAGVTGELLIGGAGLARGYLNRPALTAEKFIPDPFAAEPGARVYRTGDLARWNRAGKLEFMGRADRQVKVRGYRVELGEIETALAQSKQIKRAAVLAAGERLTAYLVKAEPAERLEVEALRGEIEARLPAYLRPQLYVEVEEIPLTPHGKIDEAKLKDAGAVPLRLGASTKREPPVGELERKIAAVWSELLETGEIGRDENFFDLGGHSLLATRVLSRIQDITGTAVPLREVFAAPTIATLAAVIEKMRGPAAQTQAPVIRRADRRKYIVGGETQ